MRGAAITISVHWAISGPPLRYSRQFHAFRLNKKGVQGHSFSSGAGREPISMKKDPFIIKRFLFLLAFALLGSMSKAQNKPILSGDLNHDGIIDREDMSELSSIILQQRQPSQWVLKDGMITYSSIAEGQTNLCGDINHDATITVLDITCLINIINDPSLAERLIVLNNKICFTDKSGFIFNPEDDGLIDDGEEEFQIKQ